jgi:hypothetical protein
LKGRCEMKVVCIECDNCGKSQPYHGQHVCDNCKHVLNHWAIATQLRHQRDKEFLEQLKEIKK